MIVILISNLKWNVVIWNINKIGDYAWPDLFINLWCIYKCRIDKKLKVFYHSEKKFFVNVHTYIHFILILNERIDSTNDFKVAFQQKLFYKKKYTFLSKRPWTSGSPFSQSWYWLSIVFKTKDVIISRILYFLSLTL